MSYVEPQRVTTSTFSLRIGRPFCSCTMTKSLCFFQLRENAATALLHTLRPHCNLPSFNPFPTTKFKLWPKQLSLVQLSRVHASLMLDPLSVVIPTSLLSSGSHCCNVSSRTSAMFVAVWSSGRYWFCRQNDFNSQLLSIKCVVKVIYGSPAAEVQRPVVTEK